jgi:threonine aldolase
MGNLTASLAHECRGGEVVVEEEAHIYNAEFGGLSVLAGGIARPLKGNGGILDPDAVRAALRGPGDSGRAATRLLCLENTHNAAGGAVLPLDNMAALYRIAREAGVPVHVDGARLFNAAAYLDVPVAELCRHADSVMIALSKGLGAPVGALLAGDKAFMARARRAAKMLGGAMRQAGIIAAPALTALQDPYAAPRRDHALAQRLARALAAIDASLVDAARVQTNIVNCFVDRFAPDAAAITAALNAHGILVNSRKTKIRFVTHCHIDEAAVDAAVTAMAKVLGKERKSAS